MPSPYQEYALPKPSPYQEYAEARTSRRHTTPLSPLTIQYCVQIHVIHVPLTQCFYPVYILALTHATALFSQNTLAPKHEPALHLIVRNSTATFIEADWTLFTFSGDGSISGIHPLRSDNVTWPDNVPSSHPGHLFPLHNSRNLRI